MSCPDTIPVRLVDAPAAASLSSGVAAVLHEVAARLESLVTTGEAGAIDLRSLPMTRMDQRALREALGTGEVEATLTALGTTYVFETGFRGVWWVTHRNPKNEVVAESIEITDFPQILAAPLEDVSEDLEQLRRRLTGSAGTAATGPGRPAHPTTSRC